jgi:uncharacterized membrane protein YagU involved in acid resistance
MRDERRHNPWKGLVAGALGGFAAAFAMSQFHSLVLPPQNVPWQNREDSTVVAGSFISQSLFHHKLNEREKKIAGPVVHYAFGASMAAAYGTIVEWEPVTAAGWGIPFGIVVWLGAHVITVPALGLSEAITRSTLPAEATEFAAHLVYGTVTEAVRRLVRSCVLP